MAQSNRPVKIGVISDTHIPDRAKEIPAKILEEFKNVDMIVHAGDLVSLEALDMLKKTCPDVKAVYGNMDPQEVRKKLREREIINISGFNIGLMHGWGPPKDLIKLLVANFKNDNVQAIIFGHSHAPFNEVRDNILYFNPGSPTDKVFSSFNSYGIIEIGDKVAGRIIEI